MISFVPKMSFLMFILFGYSIKGCTSIEDQDFYVFGSTDYTIKTFHSELQYQEILRMHLGKLYLVKKRLVKAVWIQRNKLKSNFIPSYWRECLSQVSIVARRPLHSNKRCNIQNHVEVFKTYLRYITYIKRNLNLKFHELDPIKIMRGAATGLLLIQDTYKLDVRKFVQWHFHTKRNVNKVSEYANGFTPSDLMSLSLSALVFQWNEEALYFAELSEKEFDFKSHGFHKAHKDAFYNLSSGLKNCAKHQIYQLLATSQNLSVSKFLPFQQSRRRLYKNTHKYIT